MRAIAPKEMPALPAECVAWARNRRRGSVYHAHVIGIAACGSAAVRDRHKTEEPRHLGDMQYWGVCPRCIAKGKA